MAEKFATILIDEERLYVGNYENREDIKLKQKSRKRSEIKKQDASVFGGNAIPIRSISLMISFTCRVMSV